MWGSRLPALTFSSSQEGRRAEYLNVPYGRIVRIRGEECLEHTFWVRHIQSLAGDSSDDQCATCEVAMGSCGLDDENYRHPWPSLCTTD
jgi:hypothetical protein